MSRARVQVVEASVHEGLLISVFSHRTASAYVWLAESCVSLCLFSIVDWSLPRTATASRLSSTCSSLSSGTDEEEHKRGSLSWIFAASIGLTFTSKTSLLKQSWEESRCHVASRWIFFAIEALHKSFLH